MGAGHKFLAGIEEVRRIQYYVEEGACSAEWTGKYTTPHTRDEKYLLLGKVPSGRQSAFINRLCGRV